MTNLPSMRPAKCRTPLRRFTDAVSLHHAAVLGWEFPLATGIVQTRNVLGGTGDGPALWRLTANRRSTFSQSTTMLVIPGRKDGLLEGNRGNTIHLGGGVLFIETPCNSSRICPKSPGFDPVLCKSVCKSETVCSPRTERQRKIPCQPRSEAVKSA